MGIIVAKFGGTSLADSYQLEKVKKIIESNPDRNMCAFRPGKKIEAITSHDLIYLWQDSIEHNVLLIKYFKYM